MYSDKDRCKKCDADKVVRERKVLEVHIDKGMKDGHKFHFRGESNQVHTRRGHRLQVMAICTVVNFNTCV